MTGNAQAFVRSLHCTSQSPTLEAKTASEIQVDRRESGLIYTLGPWKGGRQFTYIPTYVRPDTHFAKVSTHQQQHSPNNSPATINYQRRRQQSTRPPSWLIPSSVSLQRKSFLSVIIPPSSPVIKRQHNQSVIYKAEWKWLFGSLRTAHTPCLPRYPGTPSTEVPPTGLNTCPGLPGRLPGWVLVAQYQCTSICSPVRTAPTHSIT